MGTPAASATLATASAPAKANSLSASAALPLPSSLVSAADVPEIGVAELLCQVDALNVENARLRTERDELVRQRDAAKVRLRDSGRPVVRIRDGHAEVLSADAAAEARQGGSALAWVSRALKPHRPALLWLASAFALGLAMGVRVTA